ncbi:MAG: mechanosensitive ion channel family protein [Armatimonadetes bacterium]|nr:mechanosensitive ion channel family protein [Armatimonadota bacterium]
MDRAPMETATRTHLTIETFPLFRIAGNERLSAQYRAELVRARVRRLLDAHGQELPPVTVEQVLGATVVRAGDEILITVLEEDVPEFNLNHLSPDERLELEAEVAEAWRDALEAELARGAYMRTPAYHRIAWGGVLLIVLVAVLAHRLVRWMGSRYFHSPIWSVKFLIWALAVFLGLKLFPASQDWAGRLYDGLLHPFLLLGAVVVGTLAASSVAEMLAHRYFVALQKARQSVHLSRLGLRLATLDQAARVTVRLLFLLAGSLLYLTMLDVNLGAVLTGAGVAGVAVGLACQDYLKDMVGGINILMEDHFGVGDIIEWGAVAGTVESFTLRTTQVRTMDGRLVTIPNHELRVVCNHSNRWGRVDYKVRVSFATDLGRALAVLTEEAEKLAGEWSDRIPDPPVVLGVDELGDFGPCLRLLLRTAPLSQWEVRRELNRRVKDRFDREGIEIPVPQRVVFVRTAEALAQKKERVRV